MRRTPAVAALFLASCTLSIALVEAVVAQIHQPVLDLGQITPENFAASGRYTPPLNRYGHREQELHDGLFEARTKRILLLGDSFTFGDGVYDGADRFSDLLEARLNREFDAGAAVTRFHLYNAGVSGSTPVHWYRVLDRLLPVYRPDHVLSVFFLRDGTDLCTSLRCHQAEIDAIRAQYARRWLYRHTNTGRYFYDRLIAAEFTKRYQQRILDAYLGSHEQREHWEGAQFFLKQIQRLCEERGISHHLVIFPMLFDLDDYPYRAVESGIARFAAENGIPVFSLLSGFEGRDAEELWVSPNDQHPNEKGHAIAADTLYPYLVELLRSSSSAPSAAQAPSPHFPPSRYCG